MKARQIKEYDPALHTMARVQDQLDAVLNDSSFATLQPDDRLKLLQRLQHRFSEVKHEGDTQVKLAGVSTVMPEPTVAAAPVAPVSAVLPQLPLIGINGRYHTHAGQLIKHIFQDPSTLSVNERKEIVVKGHPVPGSNAVDLLSDVFATKKSRVEGPRPPGFSEFLSALKDVNAPRTLLVNPKYSSSLTSSSSNPLNVLHLAHKSRKRISLPSSKVFYAHSSSKHQPSSKLHPALALYKV